MHNLSQSLIRHWKVSSLFGLFVVVYTLETLLVDPARTTLTRYQIGASQVHWLQLAVILPYMVIWVIALVGYVRLSDYSQSLGKSKDGAAFRLITVGVLWFTLWLPLAVFLSSFGNAYYARHPDTASNVVRLQNYLNYLFLVPAFMYVYQGSVRLTRLARLRTTTLATHWMMGYLVFAAIYTYITLEDVSRRVPTTPGSPATYYLPDWLIIVSLVIPRLLIWFIGVLAVHNIVLYRRKVAGIIYRQALKRLAIGLAVVISMTILLRSIQSLTHQLAELSLALVFVVVYALLAGFATGFIFIAKGAKRLAAIEES